MQTHRAFVVAGCLLGCIGAVFFFRGRSEAPPQVEYHVMQDDAAFDLDMECVAATADLGSVPMTPITREFVPGETIQIKGALVAGENVGQQAIVVQFVEHRKQGGNVVANSGTCPSEAGTGNFQLAIKVPRGQGKYSLYIQTTGDKNFVARGEVTVRRRN